MSKKPQENLEYWKQRALDQEKELEQLKQGPSEPEFNQQVGVDRQHPIHHGNTYDAQERIEAIEAQAQAADAEYQQSVDTNTALGSDALREIADEYAQSEQEEGQFVDSEQLAELSDPGPIENCAELTEEAREQMAQEYGDATEELGHAIRQELEQEQEHDLEP